jgi:hypothetical protein
MTTTMTMTMTTAEAEAEGEATRRPTMEPSERRLIPDPALPRSAIAQGLRARGFALVSEEPRAHLAFRSLLWRTDAGAEVRLTENHVLGARYVVLEGEVPAEIESLFAPLSRESLLAEAESGGPAALGALRHLCLLEHDAPSAEVVRLVERVLNDPDVVVRRMALNMAVLSYEPAHLGLVLEAGRRQETDPRMRALYGAVLSGS